jgi:hypothetical protein
MFRIESDHQTPRVREEIRRYSSQYSARLSAHPNDLTVNLMEQPDNRRLRRHQPNGQILNVTAVFAALVLWFSFVSFPKVTTALLSTLLHAAAQDFTLFADCTGTDCK